MADARGRRERAASVRALRKLVDWYNEDGQYLLLANPRLSEHVLAEAERLRAEMFKSRLTAGAPAAEGYLAALLAGYVLRFHELEEPEPDPADDVELLTIALVAADRHGFG